MVGCRLVRRGQILGEGWHTRFGGPHAEVEALNHAKAQGFDVVQATAYVSLEPCRHEGKTPPCTRALTEAGVTRVIYGASDPGEASGGGGDVLREGGVEVVGPVFSADEAWRENPGFFPGRTDPHRPWLVLKLARTADGWIAERPGVRSTISGPEAGARVQSLRAGVDGILVGSTTARVDDPCLTARTSPPPRVAPTRILLDRTASLPHRLRVFRDGDGPVLLVQGDGVAAPVPIPGPGAPVSRLILPERDARLPLPRLLGELSARGFRAILCEGGGVVARALLDADLVDRLVLITGAARGWSDGVLALPGFPPDWTPPAPRWVRLEGPEHMGGGDQWEVWDRTQAPFHSNEGEG
jgi:diaminohydroxyphosphoribosylaminopyrimidine deaminase/5-amino-6-(5-phosphoribosylamino)uracil reductase